MPPLLVRAGLGLVFSALSLASALAFDSTGPWDSTPFDNPVRPSASIGATIASAGALANSRAGSAGQTSKQKASRLQISCSLNLASPTLSRGASNSTIVLQADVRAPIIQVCR